MPKFTVECSYMLPVFRHRTYEADSPEAAAALALADEDWSGQKDDTDSIGPHKVTGIWEGEDAAYSGPAVAVVDLDDMMRDAAHAMYGALKIAEEQYENFAGAGKDDGTLSVIRAAIAKAEGRSNG